MMSQQKLDAKICSENFPVGFKNVIGFALVLWESSNPILRVLKLLILKKNFSMNDHRLGENELYAFRLSKHALIMVELSNHVYILFWFSTKSLGGFFCQTKLKVQNSDFLVLWVTSGNAIKLSEMWDKLFLDLLKVGRRGFVGGKFQMDS